MGFSRLASALAVCSLLSGASAASVENIVMKGSKLFYSNGTQFFIRGVAYQQDVQAGGQTTGTSYVDPLSNATLCQRDIPLLQQIGTNVIRTYAIDPTADHSQCMSMLQDAGIYVISDLSEPSLSIDRNQPEWNTQLYTRYTSVIDELVQYDNVIGFFAGNEVTNAQNNTAASAYVKAAVRDMKAYVKTKSSRWFGVGYAANDDADIRADLFQYMNCGDQASAIDYLGFNIYEWCGDNTFVGSGYAARTEFFQNYSVPVFFAEYGCNTVGGAEGRLWEDTSALYSDNMTGVWSGGIVYMYFEETNDYGIVTIADNGQASTMKNYGVLSTRLASATPSGTASSAYNPTNSPQPCPALFSGWVANNTLPPTPNATVCGCMFSGLSCVPKPGLSTESYGSLFGTICGFPGNPCAGILGNVTSGVYGAFSMCNSTEQLGQVLDTYYKSQGSSASACDFSGQAVTTKPPAVASTCAQALSSATNTASSSSSSSFAVPMPMRGVLTLGDLKVGVYVLAAMGVGASMVLL